MDEKNELTQIVREVQKDSEQFEKLYSHVINKVYYWCYSIVKNEALAKDLAQESMIKLHQKLHTLDNAEAFNSWLYVLVRNSCYYYLRSNKNADVSFLESGEYDEKFEDTIADEKVENLPEEAYDLQETKKLMISFIQELPTKQREVIILFYLEEFTTVEISEMLNYNVSTVKSHLYFGRKNLEKQINEYQEKNHIKLYSTILLPLLGALLQEDYRDFSKNHDLTYKRDLFKSNSSVKNLSVKGFVSLHMTSIVGLTLVGIAVVVTLVSIFALGWLNTSNQKENNTDDSVVESEMFAKENIYVDSVTRSTFPTRGSTEVIAHLKKDVTNKDVKIMFKDKEVLFNKNGKQLILIAKDNGDYTLIINEKKFAFNINTIDAYAPELVEIKNHGEYLQLLMNDEEAKVNYEKSYIEFQKEKYPITSKKQVIGKFHGEIVVYIYDNLNHYAYYNFDLE